MMGEGLRDGMDHKMPLKQKYRDAINEECGRDLTDEVSEGIQEEMCKTSEM